MKWSILLPVLGFVATSAAVRADLTPALSIEGYTDQLSYRPGGVIDFHISTTASRYAMEITRLGPREPRRSGARPTSRAHRTRSPRTRRRTAATGRCRIASRFPRTGRAVITTSGCESRDNGGKFVGRNRRTAEVDLFFIVRPAEPGQGRANPASALHQHLQRLQQLGRLQPLRLPRPGQAPGAPRLVQPARSAASSASGSCRSSPGPSATATRSTTARTATSSFTRSCSSRYKLVLSVGHDEYWSAPMRDHLEAFIAQGRQRRLLQRQYLLLAGAQRGRRPRADLLEAGVQPGSGLPDRRPSHAHHALEPSPGQAARESAHRRRLSLGRLSPQPRPVHGRQGGVHRRIAPTTGSSRERPEARRSSSAARTRSSATSATAASSDWRTDCPSRRIATARRRTSSSSPPARRAGIPTTPSGTTVSRDPPADQRKGRPSSASTRRAGRSSPSAPRTGRTASAAAMRSWSGSPGTSLIGCRDEHGVAFDSCSAHQCPLCISAMLVRLSGSDDDGSDNRPRPTAVA